MENINQFLPPCPFNKNDAPMDDTAKKIRWRIMKNNRNMNLDAMTMKPCAMKT